VLDYAGQFGHVKEITIIPGINYGHFVFAEAESVTNLMASLPDSGSATFYENRVLVFFPTTLEQGDLKT